MSHFKTFVCCLQNVKPNVIKKWESNGAKIIKCKNTSDGKVNLTDALSKLGSLGFNNIFCEGGSTLATNLIYNDLVEELVLIKFQKKFVDCWGALMPIYTHTKSMCCK